MSTFTTWARLKMLFKAYGKKGGSLNKQDRQKQILLQILASLNQYGQVYTSLYQFRQVCYNSNKFVLIQTSLDKF